MTPSAELALPATRREPAGHCLYCGARCRGSVCNAHADLPWREPLRELHEEREEEAAA